MNQKLKQAGLFAILAVFTISMTTSFVGNAEASPQSRGDITSEPVELSVRAQQLANAAVEVKPEAPRSESDQNRPAGETPEPSIKAQQRAQSATFDPQPKEAYGHSGSAGLGETPEPSSKAKQIAQARDQ